MSASTTTASTTSTSGPGGNKLAQEINDEFLTCKICLEGYKSPKCLDCLHTFCEQCIDNHIMNECTYKKYSDYREFTCPLCRKRTQLPLGGVKKLPDNFLVSSLSELVQRQRPSKFPFCDICKLVNRKHREATSKCLDCNKLLCKQCVEMHKETKVTKNHSIFDVEIEKDIECKEHSEEVVRFYCEPCEACICVLCTFNEHKDHEITQFSEAVVKYKENISCLLDDCKEKISTYDTQLEALSKCETVIRTTEQKVRDTAIQFIADIRTKEKKLIDDLHEIYGSDVMDYVSKRNDMQANVDSLKSTCSLTELVLRGKDIELLLLKKTGSGEIVWVVTDRTARVAEDGGEEHNLHSGWPRHGILRRCRLITTRKDPYPKNICQHRIPKIRCSRASQILPHFFDSNRRRRGTWKTRICRYICTNRCIRIWNKWRNNRQGSRDGQGRFTGEGGKHQITQFAECIWYPTDSQIVVT